MVGQLSQEEVAAVEEIGGQRLLMKAAAELEAEEKEQVLQAMK